MKCCKCNRKANLKHTLYDWMCSLHYNRLIKLLRINRKLNKPPCFKTMPSYQTQAENDYIHCKFKNECLK